MLFYNRASFAGIDTIYAASYTCSNGITPSQVLLSVPPSALAGIAEFGDVVLDDGHYKYVIPDCKVTIAPTTKDGSGERTDIVLLDHRWRWEFGVISGRYNVREIRTNTVTLIPIPGRPGQNPGTPRPDPPGTEPIRPSTKKNAQELATLCLKAMGEKRFNVRALDRKAFPSIEWDAANPAASLQSLVEPLGCVVVWRNDKKQVWICKKGVGARLPGGGMLADAAKLSARARPSVIRLVYAHTRFQQRFRLEAVGEDFDGSIRVLDKLSYRPDDGDWTNVRPPYFGNLGTTLPGNRSRQDAIALAASSVYRMYRIADTRTDGIGPPLRVPPLSREKKANVTFKDIRPLPFLNQTSKDDIGRMEQAPSRCIGRHTPPDRTEVDDVVFATYDDTDVDTEVRVPFQIDAERQLVVFNKYVFSSKDDGLAYPAELYLECAAEVADPLTHQYRRGFKELKIKGGLKTEPAIVIREDMWAEVTTTYKSGSNDPSKTVDNLRDMQKLADYYLRGESLRFALEDAEDRSYPGLKPLYPDGAIQQTTHAVGGGSEGNPSTRASRNTEHNLYLPTPEARRRLEETDLNGIRRTKEQFRAIQNRLGARVQLGPGVT